MINSWISLKVGFYAMSLLWTSWLIIKSFDTACFSLFDGYMTILTLSGSMVLNDLIG